MPPNAVQGLDYGERKKKKKRRNSPEEKEN